MKNFLLVCFLSVVASANAQQSSDAKMNSFIDNLMRRMTLQEKIGQLNLPSVGFDVTGPVLSQGVEDKIKKGLVGGVFNTYTPEAVRKLQQMAVTQTRMKIPLLFGYDVIHGHRTIFPINLGLAATWDPVLVEKTARAAAEEASADGLNWVYSPMVDITRDPRWGRVSEGSGEDPFLGSVMAKAMVNGYQLNDLSKDNTVMACVKHFALYGAAEAGRDYNTVDMSKVRMYNEYLPPYKAAVDAGVGSVMTSFNTIDGVPASGNKWLLTDLLRNQWGFKGLVVSDYTSINEMVNHGMGDNKKVAELALNAGMDMDMVGEEFLNYAEQLVNEGKVPEKTIDDECRKILEAKYKLGLFSNPFLYVNEERNKKEIMSQDKLNLSKQAAIESMVLLKNKDHVLPLDRSSRIAFIGPLVKDQRDLIGSWSGAGDYTKAISIWSAIEQAGYKNVLYAKGCNLVDDPDLIKQLNPHGAMLIPDSLSPQQLIDQAVRTAYQSDVVVAVLGEPFGMSGEAASVTDIRLLENQRNLLEALKKTGKPIVLVLMNGRPLDLSWEDANLDGILETWYAGTMAGPAITDVLYGNANPSGKITMSFPVNVGQVPVYYNHLPTGRPYKADQKYTTRYLDAPNDPLYPFGYGLSYTNYNYSSVALSSNTLNTGGSITASVNVTNTGDRAGTETVQLYMRQMVGSISRPVKELIGFQQVALAPGETKKVSFKVTDDDLKFYNSNLQYNYEPGDFKLFIGTNSRDVKEADFVAR
ncbi:MAG: beta-glucosidase BglX [Chitinophagaceae bacterium]|nr:beta-glucosidase BglX [Chitinophagaceae bacterium]